MQRLDARHEIARIYQAGNKRNHGELRAAVCSCRVTSRNNAISKHCVEQYLRSWHPKRVIVAEAHTLFTIFPPCLFHADPALPEVSKHALQDRQVLVFSGQERSRYIPGLEVGHRANDDLRLD